MISARRLGALTATIAMAAVFGSFEAPSALANPPVCADEEYTVAPGVSVALQANCTDTDGPSPLSYLLVTGPAHGSIVGADPATGRATYVSSPGFVGDDSFLYSASDGAETSNNARVTIHVVNPPVTGLTVNAIPVSGVVARRCPGDAGFVPLTEVASLPLGCEIDTRTGTVRLTSSSGSGGGTQTADFWSGLFRVTQDTGPVPTTVLALTEKLRCGGTKGRRRGSAKSAGGGGRRLWGSGKGRFQTKGGNGAATVRGTTWLVADRCDSTRVKVAEGVVSFRDFVKRRTVSVRAPGSYTAKTRR